MELLDRIKDNATRIVGVFTESPLLCSFLICIFTLSSVFCIRGLVNGLFEMHRSRSNLKKIRKNNSICHKLIMKPAWDECLHAKSFCRFLIVVHHIRFCLFLISISLALISIVVPSLMSATATVSGCIFLMIDIPVLILHVVLDQ